MKAVLVNYNFTPSWLFDYPALDYVIYDRSDEDKWLADFPKERIIKRENKGNVDYDKLSYLVDNYDSLPDVFLWSKSNLFKFITKEEFNLVKDNKVFTPLLTKGHRTYADARGPVCYYAQGIYWERNDSWYLHEVYPKYIDSWEDWARRFHLPTTHYLPFAPGGNYLLTRERVHRYSRDFYEEMMNLLPYAQLPGEAHCAERSYFLLWS